MKLRFFEWSPKQTHRPKDSPLLAEPNVRNNSKWCRVAYWEFRERVGDMYSFSSNSVSVAPEETDGDSISLESLFRSHGGPACAEVSKTRTKIGNGVSIFRDAENAVWLYNRSSSTIFVSSRIFLQTTFPSSGTSPSLSIMKLPPGHLIKAYDLAIAQRLRPLQSGTHKSQHNHVFSFSFVKGFGPNYSRQDIMQCPCWMEVILDLASSPSETAPPTVAAALLARDH